MDLAPLLRKNVLLHAEALSTLCGNVNYVTDSGQDGPLAFGIKKLSNILLLHGTQQKQENGCKKHQTRGTCFHEAKQMHRGLRRGP